MHGEYRGYKFDYQNLEITVTKADDLMAQEINVCVKELPSESEDSESED